MHSVLSGTSSVVQCSSSKGTVWKSPSSLSSSRYTWASAGVALRAGGTSSGVSLLLEKLNVSHLHTSLGGVQNLLHGMTGSGLNEAWSTLDMWWILGVFLSGVGMLIVSELLS